RSGSSAGNKRWLACSAWISCVTACWHLSTAFTSNRSPKNETCTGAERCTAASAVSVPLPRKEVLGGTAAETTSEILLADTDTSSDKLSDTWRYSKIVSSKTFKNSLAASVLKPRSK